jgi:two-component system LytT family response regulator
LIKTVIVDDENSGRVLLATLLESNFPEIEIVGSAESVDEGVAIIENERPDLVFLDVKMPGQDGFDLLERLTHLNFMVVFTTAYNEYAVRAIRAEALDYLLKPIDIDELKKAVEKASEKQREPKGNDLAPFFEKLKKIRSTISKVAIGTNDGIEFIPQNDIIRCEADSNYTQFHLKDGRKLLSARTLKEYEKMLEFSTFFRVHKSHIVNLNYVTRYIRSGHVLMEDNSTVEVSRRMRDSLLKKLLE